MLNKKSLAVKIPTPSKQQIKDYDDWYEENKQVLRALPENSIKGKLDYIFKFYPALYIRTIFNYIYSAAFFDAPDSVKEEYRAHLYNLYQKIQPQNEMEEKAKNSISFLLFVLTGEYGFNVDPRKTIYLDTEEIKVETKTPPERQVKYEEPDETEPWDRSDQESASNELEKFLEDGQ